MKKILWFMMVLCAMSVQAQKMTVDKVVARVGNSAILYSEVEEAAADMAAQYKEAGRTSDRDLFYEALETLMERKLAYNQALIDSLVIDESTVANEAGELLGMQIEEAGGVRELERMHNMTVIYVFCIYLRTNSVAYDMQRNIYGKATITPGEVELFYAKIPADSVPTVPEQYMYAQITRFPANMKEAKEQVRENLMELRERVVNGNSRFETLARLYSEDQDTGAKGGELPPLELEHMDPAWQPEVEHLRPGQVSEVVETEYGLQIIQLVEKAGNKYHLRYIIRRPKYSVSDLAVAGRFLDSLATVIRADSITFEAAARKHSDDAATRQNGGIATNTELLQITQRGQASGAQMVFKFKREDFEYNIRDYLELSKLKPGEVSNAFTSRDLKGNELSKIVKLLEIFPTHDANLTDDYVMLEQAALDQKRDRVYREWLEQTIAATHVYVDPAYRDASKWRDKSWIR